MESGQSHPLALRMHRYSSYDASDGSHLPMIGHRRRLAIVGAGGFGREVLDIVRAVETEAGFEFIGFLDDGAARVDLLDRLGVEMLGSSDALPGLAAEYVIGIGAGAVRAKLAAQFELDGCVAARLCHPLATVGADVRIAEGVIIAAGARITTNIELGPHVNIHVNATVGHDSELAAFASVYPGATVSGNTYLGRGSTIGTGANVLPGIRIGDGAIVGAGAVVTRDVPSGSTVVGSPARPLG